MKSLIFFLKSLIPVLLLTSCSTLPSTNARDVETINNIVHNTPPYIIYGMAIAIVVLVAVIFWLIKSPFQR